VNLPRNACVFSDAMRQSGFDRLISMNGNDNDFPFARLAENVVAALDALQWPTRFTQPLAELPCP
jgi:hypothetical protein